MDITTILDKGKLKLDNNGIWVTDLSLSNEARKSQETWEKIYDFNLKKLKVDRIDFRDNKLRDHISYICKDYHFTSNTIYLEIGCGPSYIGEYLGKKYHCYFMGIDFNYQVLISLKKYFDEIGLRKYVLVHADINYLPIKPNSVDFIYGGGVIEHFKDTQGILAGLYKILKKNGVAFNTIPAFNLFWLTRFWNNIPSFMPLKKIFEIIHIRILNYALLNRYHGYELSYTLHRLTKLYKKAKFNDIKSGSFAFHPSAKKMSNKFLVDLYYKFSKNTLFAPIYYVFGRK